MTPISYIPVIAFLMLIGLILWYKSRSIAVPLIIMLAFMTSIGPQIAANIGIVGFILGGALILGLVAIYLKFFY